MPSPDHVISPIMLYIGCALGALGVVVALPRPKIAAFPFGAMIGAVAFGLVMIVLAANHPARTLPNYNFYIFSIIALGGALRVISHPRPVYAALYFVLTILASAGLYLILAAEFMAFALIIVYAGAILITYLFVIMLATESPSEEEPDALNEYDRVSREPVGAVIAGFILLAALTTMFSRGSAALKPDLARAADESRLMVMTKKVTTAFREAGQLGEGEEILRERAGGDGQPDRLAVDPRNKTVKIRGKDGQVRTTDPAHWPRDLSLTNTEGVAFELIERHPGSIEIAGVILLMAMLGAVVLARKKVEMEERAKAAALARQRAGEDADELGIEGGYAAPGVGEGGQPA